MIERKTAVNTRKPYSAPEEEAVIIGTIKMLAQSSLEKPGDGGEWGW